MSEDKKLVIEATAIVDELRLRIENNPNIKDLLAMASLTDSQREVIQSMLFAAISEGFRIGLEYGFILLDQSPSL